MPTNSSQERLTLTYRVIALAFCSLAAFLMITSAATAQDGIASPQRSSSKVVVPSLGKESANVTPDAYKDVKGMTYVTLAPELENVFRGREPATLLELKALEAQQSLVAEAIETVTVNVQQGSAQGSGVIITADGYVLTAAHVAGGKDREAWIVLNDGTRVRARTLGMNRDKDAGLLKIVEPRSTPWPHATPGRSSELTGGQWVIASGHPGGWKPERGAVIRVGRVLSISRGPVRRGSSDRSAHTLFTDCALIGGDSGGPLFTLEGKLVGIHSRIGTKVEDNMHVPIDVFDDSWDRMVRKEVWGVLPGYQPVIGVGGANGDDRPLIASIARGGPASKAGLDVGDLILTVDGDEISTFEELQESVMTRMPGDAMTVTVQREDQILRMTIIVGVAEN